MVKKFFSLAELAEMTDSVTLGDSDYLISNVSDLQSANAEDISFFSNPRYEQVMKKSKAGAIFINNPDLAIPGKNFLINKNPSKAFQVVLETFYHATNKTTGFSGIHPTAVIHESAFIGENVNIGPKVVIEQDAKIGNNCFIGAGSYIGFGVTIGENTHVHANVTIREFTEIGKNVIIHPGVVIGSCGFGLITGSDGRHHKLKQVGIVKIEDEVEIGSNTTIDRPRFNSTFIGYGTKIDNLVQIGHGVKIGKNCVIVAQVGIAGSTEIDDNVIIGGQTGIAGHLKIHSNVSIAAKSGVSKSITQPGNYRGVPAVPVEEFNRNTVLLRQIDKFLSRLKKIEMKVKSTSE